MAVEKAMASSSLAEVVDRILDKGVVIDAWARVSLVGIATDCDRSSHRGRQRRHVPEVRRGHRLTPFAEAESSCGG